MTRREPGFVSVAAVRRRAERCRHCPSGASRRPEAGASVRFVELDAVARGVPEEGLAAGAGHVLRAPDLHPRRLQLGHGSIEVVDPQRQVLAPVDGGRWDLHQVDLVVAGLDPGPREPEVGPVERGEPELVDVELQRRLQLVDVDGDVVQPGGLHDTFAPSSTAAGSVPVPFLLMALPLPPPVAPASRLRASCRPATPWDRAWARASDRPCAPFSTIIWSMLPNGLAAASTMAGHCSASCWPMTASWFSARASARALIASASAMPLACTASPSARPLAAVADASPSPMSRVDSERAMASTRTRSASATASSRTRSAEPLACSSTSWRSASAAAMRASRPALARVTDS